MKLRTEGYAPIEAYGAIGNLRTIALIARDGAIDWCCMPRLDAPSVFGALLDAEKGGTFRIRPREEGELPAQDYLTTTNVLETVWRRGEGVLRVTDWMPVRGDLEEGEESHETPALLRRIRCEDAPMEVEVEWMPRLDYARNDTRIEREGDDFVARHEERDPVRLQGLPGGRIEEGGDGGPTVRLMLRMKPGDEEVLVTDWADERPDPGRLAETLGETCDAWRAWADRCGEAKWAGDTAPLVQRSQLALKLLTYPGSGAMAAAGTTSLPEWIGGIRNWDYRYSWIRDASLTGQALLALGHKGDARAFLYWMEEVAEKRESEDGLIPIMFTLDGTVELEEDELDHLAGYRNSTPVRIGNGAADQLQLDVFAELLGSAAELVRIGDTLPDSMCGFLARMADHACEKWEEPDEGIWEIRLDPRKYTYSRIMVWMALDRAVALAEQGEIEGDVERWRETRRKVHAAVLAEGVDEETGALTMAFGDRDLDAANLLASVYRFLPPDDPRILATIDRTREELEENGLVFRYKIDDGLAGPEGAFVLCSFWLVDALVLAGRIEEAESLFERLCARTNHVGLFSEQIDPASGVFLGNFPQAFSHIGLINSACYLAHAKGLEVPGPTPLGFEETLFEG